MYQTLGLLWEIRESIHMQCFSSTSCVSNTINAILSKAERILIVFSWRKGKKSQGWIVVFCTVQQRCNFNNLPCDQFPVFFCTVLSEGKAYIFFCFLILGLGLFVITACTVPWLVFSSWIMRWNQFLRIKLVREGIRFEKNEVSLK